MTQTNWFMISDRDGNFVIGRTDAECQVNPNAKMPNGTLGRMVVAPNDFVSAFRTMMIETNKVSLRQLLNNQFSLNLYRKAMVAWEDNNKSALLRE